MGIFLIETKSNWDDVEQAIRDWEQDRDHNPVYYRQDVDGVTPARRRFDQMQEEILEALAPVRVDRRMIVNQVSKLCIANNVDRAILLVKAARRDFQPRLWFWIVVMLVTWPFRLVWSIIKLGLPG